MSVPARSVPRPATRRAPARSAADRGQRRLRAVDSKRVQGARRARRLVAALSLVVAVVLVGAVAFHVQLAQGQLRLDEAREELAAEQEQYEKERFETAAAAAPAQILERAKALGMIEPSEVIFISTRPGTAPVESPDQGSPVTTLADWGDVKEHLGTTQP